MSSDPSCVHCGTDMPAWNSWAEKALKYKTDLHSTEVVISVSAVKPSAAKINPHDFIAAQVKSLSSVFCILALTIDLSCDLLRTISVLQMFDFHNSDLYRGACSIQALSSGRSRDACVELGDRAVMNLANTLRGTPADQGWQ